MMKKPPSWNDESSVAKLVAAELEELRLEVDRWAWTSLPWEQFPTEPEDLVEMGKLVERENRWPDEEEQACEAALRGDLMPLVNLLTPDIFEDIGINLPNVKIPSLKPSTWTLSSNSSPANATFAPVVFRANQVVRRWTRRRDENTILCTTLLTRCR